MADYIIESYDLTKIYKLKGQEKEIIALNNANFKVKEGEVFGLLGPNGAGKTTLVQILTTLLQPTSGYATIAGYNIQKKSLEIKKKIGLMLGSGMIYNRLKGYDYLKFFCKIYGIQDYRKKIIDIVGEFDLEKWLHQYIENYSLGMKIKLSLCRILLIDPILLFLDEPTLGLDVTSRLSVINKLKEFKDKTIFLTSHNMNVIEKLCHRIAFINHGNIIKIGSQNELKNLMKIEIQIYIEIYENKNKLKDELHQQDFIKEINFSEGGLILILRNKKDYHQLFSILSRYNTIQKIQEQDNSLDELFINLA